MPTPFLLITLAVIGMGTLRIETRRRMSAADSYPMKTLSK
jgi:hypothetical protein